VRLTGGNGVHVPCDGDGSRCMKLHQKYDGQFKVFDT
jgi:hypothetical protein